MRAEMYNLTPVNTVESGVLLEVGRKSESGLLFSTSCGYAESLACESHPRPF